MGDHGLMQKALLHYQGLIRVPFIWVDPEEEKPGMVAPELACSQDIPNSILARASLAPCAGMQGQDLTNLLFHGAISSRDGILVQQTTAIPLPGDDRPTQVKTFVDHEWRLSYYLDKNWGELYNLKEDPDEIVNLWHAPEHQIIRLELMERMLKSIVEGELLSPIQVNVG